jgi:murein DD-endopeptidase MepM/ murein hydrolase activator NlpD
MDPLSLELELMYLWHEFETNPAYGLEPLKKAGDVRQATWVFLVFFERPAATSGYEENPQQATSGSAKAALDDREALAKKVTGGGETASPAIDSAAAPTTDAAPECEQTDSTDDGGVYSADGYTFPLKLSRKTITENQPAWCYKNKNNCHHDYNASDIFAPTGTPVLATRGGRVVTARDNATDPSTIGTRISIMGDDGWLYYYAHMGTNTLQVKSGQTVAAGAKLGEVGTKENAAGTPPHLHIDRLPGKDYKSRPNCSGAACSGYPLDNIQGLMSKLFELVK